MLRHIDRVRSRLARWALQRDGCLIVGPAARVDARRLSFKPRCRLEVGARSIVEAAIDLERDGATVRIGENSYVGASIIKCAELVQIGRDVEIAWNCSIVDHDWEPIEADQRGVDMRSWYSADKDWSDVRVAPVHIGDRVLIGFNAVILKGVRIGEGAVVGVQSVVTRDVPPHTVVAGAPARVIRYLRGSAASGIEAQSG